MLKIIIQYFISNSWKKNSCPLVFEFSARIGVFIVIGLSQISFFFYAIRWPISFIDVTKLSIMAKLTLWVRHIYYFIVVIAERFSNR